MIRLISAFAVLALASAPAMAQSPAPGVTLEGRVQLEKTVQTGNTSKVVLEEPKVVVPGDRLLFSTDYANTGNQRVDNFVVTNPVPSAVRVEDASAAQLQVSVDAGKTYGPLTSLSVKSADGSARPARAEDITHIRWTVPAIAPGGRGKVEYHAIVR